MMEPPVSRTERWQRRWQRLRAGVKSAIPFVSGILAALIALWLYNLFAPAPQPLTIHQVNDTVAQALASATPPPAFSARVYQAIQPSLVLIQTQGTGTGDEVARSLGSGVVIDDRGDILTSLHVVADANTIQVTFADGTQSDAQVIVSQPENDIAVLQANQPPAQVFPAVLGNPNAMHVGDEAFVVGNPFGLYSSMSAGVISGFDRSFQTRGSTQRLEGLIQIDAAANPGNSGGPLLNRNGAVIGIVVGIANPTGEDVFVGIGFAVPINVATSGVGSPPY